MFDFLGQFFGKVIGVVTIAVTSLFSFGTTAPEITPKPELKKEIVAEQPAPAQEEPQAPETKAPSQRPATTTEESLVATTTPTANEEVLYIDTPEFRDRVSRSVVNIFCTLKSIGPDRPLTASGVIVDDRGVIMTNAHVAQYILLDNYLDDDQITCTARAGSPAQEAFEIEVLYVSPEWVETQSKNLFSRTPIGTGQNDYALLLMRRVIDNKFDNFSHIDVDVSDSSIKAGQTVLVAGYPAGILDSLTISKVLYSMAVKTDIKKLLTFSRDQIDVLSTGGSYMAQRGSSGGAVINEEGQMIGLLVTSTQEEALEDRDLRAITLSHIDRSLRSYSGIGLRTLLQGDIKEIARDFQDEIMPLLAKILLDELESRE